MDTLRKLFQPSALKAPVGLKQRDTNDSPWPKICGTCKAMTSTRRGLEALVSGKGYIHLTLSKMQRSGRKGCVLCYDMAELWNPSLLRDMNGDVKVQLFLQKRGTWKGNSLSTMYVGRGEFVTFTTPDDPASQFLNVLPVPIPVMSPTIIQLIKERLAECRKEHKLCLSSTTPMLPKRVLDVGTDSLNPSVSLHLCQSSERADYVALSYCWGGPQKIMTTSETIEPYMKSLPHDLPQTIKDAIIVTRSLGFRYLWVDALCIIQDSDDDKATEIDNMGSIYKFATLTIAAASASSVEEGFLQDRPVAGSIRLPFYISNKESGNIYLQNASDIPYRNDPLDTRGWALQEYLLSSRVLYYEKRGLIWTCQTCDFVAVDQTHDFYVSGYLRDRFPERLPHQIFDDSEFHGDVSQSAIWKKVIEAYTNRELSDPKDRLPALAGLARELQRLWPDEYFAGFWKACLVEQIGWRPFLPANIAPEKRKSPTWSWATHGGQINFHVLTNIEAELLDVEVTLDDRNCPYGSVSWGRVIIRGRTLQKRDFEENRVSSGSCYLDYVPNGVAFPCGIESPWKILLLGDDHQNLVGLVLEPMGDGTFMRIGQYDPGALKGQEFLLSVAAREDITIV